MARRKGKASRPVLRSEEGQGVVEAVIALPVFLLLSCLLIQFFLLAMGQILLDYAAFSAARTGAVWGEDRNRMLKTAGDILNLLPGAALGGPSPIRLKILHPVDGEEQEGQITLLQIRLEYDLPLVVPIADRILSRSWSLAGGRPCAPLHSTWCLAAGPLLPEEKGGAS